MKTLLHISLLLLSLAVLSSCSKDELESPAPATEPSALITPDLIQEEETSFVGNDPIQASEVNDDGDDESAGQNPDPKKD